MTINESEAAIQLKIIHKAKELGYLVIRMNSGRARNNVRLAPAGTPDLLLVGPDGVTWVEVKDAFGKLRPEQIEMIDKLRKFGQEVIVARSVKDVYGTA